MIRSCGVAALLVAATAAPGAEFERLKGPALAARLTGMEFSDGAHYAEIFGPGGRLSGVYLGTPRSGRWRIDGDDLCLTRGDEPERCFAVFTAGSRMRVRQSETDIEVEGLLQRPVKRD